jgi:hypothetical protein
VIKICYFSYAGTTLVEFESTKDKENNSSELVKVKMNYSLQSSSMTNAPEYIDWRSKNDSENDVFLNGK